MTLCGLLGVLDPHSLLVAWGGAILCANHLVCHMAPASSAVVCRGCSGGSVGEGEAARCLNLTLDIPHNMDWSTLNQACTSYSMPKLWLVAWGLAVRVVWDQITGILGWSSFSLHFLGQNLLDYAGRQLGFCFVQRK